MTQTLARLRLTPAMSFGPESTTIVLQLRDGTFGIMVVERRFGRPKPERRRLKVDQTEAKCQWQRLKQVSVPAFPVSTQVCYGTHWKLTIQGECSELSLGWWTAVPDGAWQFAEFAEWLHDAAFPD